MDLVKELFSILVIVVMNAYEALIDGGWPLWVLTALTVVFTPFLVLTVVLLVSLGLTVYKVYMDTKY